MENLDYTYFIPLISFTGLIFGILLAKIAYEEIRPGLYYFYLIRKIILALLIITLLLNIDLSLISLISLFIGVVFGYWGSYFSRDYMFLGLCSTISFLFNKEIFFLLNILIYFFGLPKGTLFRRFKFDELYKNFLVFFIPFLILVFFLNLLSEKLYLVNFLIGICSGGLFRFLIKRNFIGY